MSDNFVTQKLPIKLVLMLVLCAQPIMAMDQESPQDAWSVAKNHPLMIATALGVTVFGVGWLVTKPARDRKFQKQLTDVLQTSIDKEQLSNAFRRSKNRMPLILRCNQAAERGDTSLVKLCFEVGVKPTDIHKVLQYDNNETSMPLWHAVCYGQPNVVALCMEHGVTVFTDIGGEHALLRAYQMSTLPAKQKMNIVAAFLEHTQDDITPIFEQKKFEWGYGESDFVAKSMPLLAKTGQAKAIAWLLKQRRIEVFQSDEEGFKAVHRAAQVGNTEVLKVLIAHDRSLASQLGPDNVTPIMLAAAGGHIDAVEVLFPDGYHPGAADHHHMTPLAHAAAQGQEMVVKKMVELMKRQYPSYSLDGPYFDKATPLHYALYNGHFWCASYLVEQGADVTCEDDELCVPLHIAASKGGSDLIEIDLMLDLVKKSSEKGVLNKKNGNGQTPLDLALVSGSKETQQTLQEAGAESSIELRTSNRISDDDEN